MDGVINLNMLFYDYLKKYVILWHVKNRNLLIQFQLILYVCFFLYTGADSEMVVTERTAGGGGGHGRGYTSHRSHNPNNPNDGGSGTPVVDPHNVATRGHHHRGAATRTAAGGDPRLAACMLRLGATFFLLVLG